MKLKDLPLNTEATITSCANCPLRMQEMGLFPGRKITKKKTSLLGNTVIIECEHHLMCLRLNECPIECE